MALRNIRTYDDEILRKKSKSVEKVDKRIKTLVDDMFETMYKADGVGLAAPQVGILKRVVVIDVDEGPIVLINPKILKTEGSNIDEEGCLSIPGEKGKVDRPQIVEVKALNKDGQEYTLRGEGLLARAICHECDHLEGILFVDKVIDESEEK